MKRISVNVSSAELDLLQAAMGTWLEHEIEEGDERTAAAERLAARIAKARGPALRLTPSECGDCGEALESHLYWEVSDPRDRNDGFVFYENDPDCPNGKMDRDDRDPAYVAECRAVDELAERFNAYC